VAGAIAAGVVGLAGIAFALLYFLRRWNRNDDAEHFDSDVFRRQSVMLSDDDEPLTRSPTLPRPPTMIERHMANATPVSSMGSQFGHPYAQGNYNVQYNSPGYNSPGFNSSGFNPPGYNSPGVGQVVTPQNPFYSPYPDSPATAHFDAPYNGDLAHQPAYLSRQPSSPGMPPPPGNNQSDAHYVDLSRSSVTPFQATQYEEISRHLDIPSPVPGPIAEEQSHAHDNADPVLGEPFADSTSDDTGALQQPSPVHSANPRVTPKPPSLPEISQMSMSPVYQLNFGLKGPSVSTGGPTIPATVHVSQGKRPDTVYTVYDDEDAYGGI